MKIAPPANIPELLAQLPTDHLDDTDIAVLKAIRTLVHALRVVDSASTGWLFPEHTRASFAVELNNAVAGVITARIPRQPSRPVGRPRNEATHAAKAEAAAAKADKKALILASNTFKARILNLIDALNACVQRMAALWDRAPDPVKRGELAHPAINPVRVAYAALKEAVPDDAELVYAVQDMDINLTKFERAAGFWINSPVPAADKNDGLHKSPNIAAWVNACRALARANALYLQRVK